MKHLPAAERRKRIVRGAMEAFAKSGFKGTRSRDLAAAAGVSEALIFKHFPNKRAIQKAIIEERIRQTGEFLSPELKKAPLEEALPAMAARILQVSERDPHFMRLLYFAGLEGEPWRRCSSSGGSPAPWARSPASTGSGPAGLGAQVHRSRALRVELHGLRLPARSARHIFGVNGCPDRPAALAEQVAALFLQGIRT
jgi:AcrR family transcriptional regulator